MNLQEQHWAGPHGDEYQKRSPGSAESNAVFFSKALAKCDRIENALELGSGSGANLEALARLKPGIDLGAVELNVEAAAKSATWARQVWNESVLTWRPNESERWDLVLTKGLLIHIAPENLEKVYDLIYRCSRRYVLIAEYYNPKPLMVPYRGVPDVLWKRDFAGELMDRYPRLRLLDVGFSYHRSAFPQDDVTHFLMERM